jgi:hypothetical protein
VAPNPPLQYVEYGTISGSYTTTVPATQFATYTSDTLCGQWDAVNSFIDPGVFVTGEMDGLLPNTKYFYRVGTLVRTGSLPFLCHCQRAPPIIRL